MQREAERLEQAGLLTSKRIGSARVVRANRESPFYPELESLLRKAFGAVPLLQHALADVEGIDRAFVFGSWAERYLGGAGPAPQDVDLLVVGDPSRRELAKVCRSVAVRLEAEVNPTVVGPSEWSKPRTAFLRSVKSGPLAPIIEH